MSLLDRVKAKQAEIDSKRLKDFSVTPPPGNSRWRILPHWSGDVEELPSHDFGQHFIKHPDTGEVRAVVVCAAKTYGKDCEVCNDITKLKAEAMMSGDEALANFYNEARAAQKHLVNAVRWEKDKGFNEEVQTLALPMTAFDQLMGLIATYYAEGVNLFDPAAGHDIIIRRQGTGRNTTYTVMAAPTASEIDKSYLEKASNLEDYVNQINEEKMRAALAALRGSSPTTAPAALPASVATPEPASAETVSEGPESVADALGDVDLDDLDLDDVDAELSDVM